MKIMEREVLGTYIMFPVLRFKKIYKLKYGIIGPYSELVSMYPILDHILSTLKRVNVNGRKIKDPVFAVSNSLYSNFVSEIEILSFIAESYRIYNGADEIFSQTLLFTQHKANDKDAICLNKDFLYDIEGEGRILTQELHKGFSCFDQRCIGKFENLLSQILNSGLYKGLLNCVENPKDIELYKEQQRIIFSLMLFNKAYIHLMGNFHSNTQIVLISAAFEALLNLTSESIGASFEHAISTLCGGKMSLIKKWCKEFYKYRSSLVHGDISWMEEERYFEPGGRSHTIIAKDLFIHCLKTKLFLMGFCPEYKRDDFFIKNLFEQS